MPKKAFDVVWNYDGSLLAMTCEDKKYRIVDPRKGEVVLSPDGHKSRKKAKITFLGQHKHYLASTGFNFMAKREVALWDMRKPEKSVS